MIEFKGFCGACRETKTFRTADDYWSCRDGLSSAECDYGACATRERALGQVLMQLFGADGLQSKIIYESSPVMRGVSLWLKNNCEHYYPTGFFPNQPFGSMVGSLRNENLECLTLSDQEVDLWIHLDVLEHVFNPFQALREIFRTLKPGGYCVFTVPTYPERVKSEQVAWLQSDGTVKVNGKPEYHGNPQHPEEGALVTWRYGYDLPLLIQRETGFDVEVRRWQSREVGVMGIMTEVYICLKREID